MDKRVLLFMKRWPQRANECRRCISSWPHCCDDWLCIFLLCRVHSPI